MKRTGSSANYETVPIVSAIVFTHNFKSDAHHTCDVYLDSIRDVRAHTFSSATLSGLNDELKRRFGPGCALPQFKGRGWTPIGGDRYVKITARELSRYLGDNTGMGGRT